MVEPASRYEEIKIPLSEPIHGLEAVSAVLGVPRWWPTGSRVGVVIAHGATGDMNSEAIEGLHRSLTERRYFSLRFNFPFAEAGKRKPDSLPVLRRTMRAALGALGRDPAADLAAARVRVDGLFLLAYPLHPPGKPEEREPEQLFRIVAPALFVQGDRDATCDVETLRQTLVRVGAPTVLRVIGEADRQFKVLKKSGRTQAEMMEQMTNALDEWIQSILGGTT